MRLMEIDEAANYIKELIDPEADLIWGSAIDPAMQGQIRVSVVATGLATEQCRERPSVPAPAPAPAPASPFMFAAKPIDPAPTPAAKEEMSPEPALADLFAADPAPTESIADAEEVLLLNSHNMRSIVISTPMTDEANGPLEESEVHAMRGPSLFERVAAIAWRGARSRPDSSFPPDPDSVEYPGVYNRRPPQNYPMRAHA
jgi:cell division protein FtsZ